MIKIQFKRIYVFHLMLWYFIHNTMGSDFCQKFIENGHKIDYGFGREQLPGNTGFLIIDNEFWKLNVNIEDKFVSMNQTQGISTAGFGKGYKMAFSHNNYTIGLITQNNSIEWTVFSEATFDPIGYTNLDQDAIRTIEAMSLPFVWNSNENQTRIGFYGHDKTGSNVHNSLLVGPPTQSYELLKAEQNQKSIDKFNDGLEKPNYEVIGIFGPYFVKYNEPSTPPANSDQIVPDRNYLILFKTNKNIINFYILNPTKVVLNVGFRTLIDCTSTATVFELSHGKTCLVEIIAIIILAILLFVSNIRFMVAQIRVAFNKLKTVTRNRTWFRSRSKFIINNQASGGRFSFKNDQVSSIFPNNVDIEGQMNNVYKVY